MARKKVNPEYVIKKCKHCCKTYKVVFYRRKRSKYCSKKCSNSDIKNINKVKETRDETYRKKYGGNHPMQTEEGKNNFKRSMVKKYGVESYSKLKEYKDKVKKTCIEKYGVSNYAETDEFKERFKKTCMMKYGVDNPMKLLDNKNKVRETCIKKYGVSNYSKTIDSINAHNDLTYCKILKFKNVTPLFSRDEFVGVTKNIFYKFRCNRCNSIISIDLNDGRKPLCDTCDKLNTSRIQKEIYEFIKEHSKFDVILNDRNQIKPSEIDILIPELKLGIEYNSFYCHSEIGGGKNKFYHLRKTKLCLLNNISLIHIFENDWFDKKEIIKSILRNKLNSFNRKIYARNCEVKVITSSESRDFLNKNHIQGKDQAGIRLGLFHEKELVSIMTFMKSRYDKKIQYEMSRFCNKLNYKILGGASKLFNFFVKKYDPETICSYSDRRFFDGHLYSTLGFSFINNTSPSYFYLKNKKILNRLHFQKHKLNKILNNFDPSKTEWENMVCNGYDRIWDCGHSKWLYRKLDVA